MSATVYVPSTLTGPQELYWGLWPTCRATALVCYHLDLPEPLASEHSEQAGTRGHHGQCTWLAVDLCPGLRPASQTSRHIRPAQRPLPCKAAFWTTNKREGREKAGHWGSLLGTAGILRSLGSGELHCFCPLDLLPVGQGLYPGAPPHLQDQRSMFPHIPGSILAWTKQDQQGIAPRTWPPHLEPLRLAGPVPNRTIIKNMGFESKTPDLKSCAFFSFSSIFTSLGSPWAEETGNSSCHQWWQRKCSLTGNSLPWLIMAFVCLGLGSVNWPANLARLWNPHSIKGHSNQPKCQHS